MTATVAALPRRVAEVTHALLEASTQNGSMPLTTMEVMLYDSEAITLAQTRTALQRAMRYGLADGTGRLWFPTNEAWLIRRALEDRICGDD